MRRITSSTLGPSTLAGRLILASTALVAVTCLLIAVITTVTLRSYLMNRLDRDLAGSLDRSQTAIGEGPFGGDGSGPPPGARGNRAGSLLVVIAQDQARGTLLTGSGRPQLLSSDELADLQDIRETSEPRTITVGDLGRYRVAAEETARGAIVVQGVPTADVEDTVRTLVLWEVGLGAAGVVAAGLAGRTLVRRQLRPLRQVADTAEQVTRLELSSGDVGHTGRVPESLTDPDTEVGQVGNSLNRLLGHVEDALAARQASEQQARQFLADASHELRTPLSTIKGYAELSRRMSEASDLSAVLGKVDTESQRMTRLVEDMLLLARLDAGREVEPRPVDLSRVVADAVTDAAAIDRDRTWHFDLPPDPIVIDGDEQRLHQLITNLLRNASRHTPEGTTVSTNVSIDDDSIRLVVADDGPGIDPDLLPVIFDRFARGDSSRTRASGGAGLGTSLVQAIAHAHGGRATVSSEPGDTRFTVTLPAEGSG